MEFDYLAYQPAPQSLSYLNGKLKRLLDVCGALLGIVLCSPTFGFAALIVHFVDRVPILFTQARVGLHGNPFEIVKLRTLKTIDTRDEVQPHNIHSKPDYITTRTGKFWRVTSIDEIAQFWLVLKGEMSLIGHRAFPVYYLPHLSRVDSLDEETIDHYLGVIYQFKPGMSSLSSVNGRGDLSMPQKFMYDLQYAQKASFWYDIWLLLRTLVVVITRRGAK